MTHVPIPRGARLPPGGDKVIHFVAYFVLTLLGGRAAMGRRRSVTLAWAVGWAIVYAAYGVADEVIQGFVGRTPALDDWLADACGVAAATAILVMYGRRVD
jgi:VanZ family protein